VILQLELLALLFATLPRPRPAANMMRGTLALALTFLAATTANAGHKCELDSADTVEHGVNAALAIWAADKRCHGTLLTEAPVKCEQDVSTSIQELIEMGSALGGMVGSCGAVKLENWKCGKAADNVVAATAGLAAAAGKIADDCAHIVPAALDGDVLDTATQLGKCTADAGDSMTTLFHAHNSIQHLKDKCGAGSRRRRKGGCTVDALDVTSVLADFGAYIAAAYTECSEYHNAAADTEASDCADGVLSGIAQLTELAKLGLEMKDACKSSSSRLYLDSNNEAASATTSPLVLALAAILPVSAVLSFVAGSRFAKSRQQTSARDAGIPGLLEGDLE
jgi:hypothetical protein